MGQGKRVLATSAAPSRWIVVDEDTAVEQREEGEEETPPTAAESSTEVVGVVEAAALAGENLTRGDDGEYDGDVDENGEGHEGGGEGDQVPPGKVRLLEYRAPPGAEGERGETRYASLGDDVSKFITFLESPVARGCRDGDADELNVAAGAGPATDRRIFASSVEVGEGEGQQSLKELWREGRLLSQERDAANVLRGQEVRAGRSFLL